MSLKNKKILITAGPTWVPIDKVRVISNIATGKTGILLANQAISLGAKVTLIIGPIGEINNLSKSVKIRQFFYFDQLDKLIKQELKEKKYDIVIHSAAVSDYKPKNFFYDKISSDIKNLSLDLESTVKIADKIKKYSSEIFLVIFKLELGITKNQMIERARKTMLEASADLAVANTISKGKYIAYIINKDKIFGTFKNKENLANGLLKLIRKEYARA